MVSLIEVKNLIKNFKTDSKSVTFALRGVNLEVKEGEFLIIEGISGSGKTTLLNMLAGLDQFDEGDIKFSGKSLKDLTLKEIERYRRHEIGIVFQDFNLVPSLSAWENVALPLRFSGMRSDERKKRALEILEIVGLKNRASHAPNTLSGGEKQRVAIARALVANPKVILADEPTGNLDSQNGAEIMNLFKELNSKYNRTIFLVTHNPLYSGYGQRILTMQDGKIIAEKKLAQVNLKKQSSDSNEAEDRVNSFKLPNFQGRMRLSDILNLSIKYFNYAKVRAFLTVAGMAIGICAITLFVSLGFGVQKLAVSSLANMDELKILTVTMPAEAPQNIDPTFVSAISSNPNVEKVVPSLSSEAVANLGNVNATVNVRGVDKNNLALEGINLISGSTFSSNEAKEIIISQIALDNLSLSDEMEDQVLGKNMTIQLPSIQTGNVVNLNKEMNTITLKIVGISEEGTGAEVDLPIGLLQEETNNVSYSMVIVQVNDLKNIEAVQSDLEKMGLEVSAVFGLINQVNKAFYVIELVLGLIGGIALIVASFSIVNTMTISLLERTREIGVMKALGISKNDIKRLFAYEACYFGLFGGLIGLTSGFILGQIANLVVTQIDQKNGQIEGLVLFITPLWFVALILIFAVLVARIAGIYPSVIANKKSSLEALRYE